jgi:hypothetical protein
MFTGYLKARKKERKKEKHLGIPASILYLSLL